MDNHKNGIKTVYLKHIDGLRAFAVCSVILYHIQTPYVTGGYIGVDIFFVISGFLITRVIVAEISYTGHLSILGFYLRRAKRIIPALFVTLVMTCLAGAILFSPIHFQHLGGTILASALSSSNLFFWNESGYFDMESQFKPLLNTWSLGVEEQFYVVWPVTIILFSSAFSERFLPVLFISVFLISFSLNLVIHGSHEAAMFYLMPFRMFEFSIGAMMTHVIKMHFIPKALLDIPLLCGIILMIYPVFTYNKKTIFPSYNAIAPAVGTILVIYAGDSKYLGWLFTNPLSRWIGLVSYSLYLVHWPLIVFYKYYACTALISSDKAVLLILCIFMASCMYLCVEQPARITQSRLHVQTQLLGYAISILLISSLGCSVYFSNGWHWRLPQTIQSMIPQGKTKLKLHNIVYGGIDLPNGGWVGNISKHTKAELVILGDSYAQSLHFGAFEVFVKCHNTTIYVEKTSCLPFPGFTQANRQCNKEAVTNALSKISDAKHSALVLFTNWVRKIPAAVVISTGKSLEHSFDDLDDPEIPEVFEGLSKLRSLMWSKKLIIIGSLPVPSSPDTTYCISRPRLGKKKCQSMFETSYYHDTNRLKLNQLFRKYSVSHRHTYFIDPYDSFCGNSSCHSIDAYGMPYYSDPQHLSKIGSLHFIASIEKRIRQIQHKTE